MPTKGVGVCPESGAKFEFEVELDEETIVQDKDGNQTKQTRWAISGND